MLTDMNGRPHVLLVSVAQWACFPSIWRRVILVVLTACVCVEARSSSFDGSESLVACPETCNRCDVVNII